MSDRPYDLVIIGGGPAGLTAGLYAARARLRAVLLEKMPLPGGLAATTDLIENYPGYPQGVSGQELSARMADQAKRFGLTIVSDQVLSASLKDAPKAITTGSSRYLAEAVIIASGTQPRRLDIPGEIRLRGKGVSYCATCDGPIFKDKDVAVIGTGDSGLQEGFFLSRFARSISFVEILPHITGEPILLERLKEKEGVKFYLNQEITEILGEKRVESVVLKNVTSEEETSLSVQGVFIYVGLEPSTQWLGREVELDQAGYVMADGTLQTSVDGVFAAGDVRNKQCRQVATAVGDGALAAYMAERYLNTVESTHDA